MDTKLKNRYKWNKTISIVLVLCLATAILYTVRFPSFRNEAKEYYENPLESEQFIVYLYQGAYLLYQDLYEKENQEEVSFEDLYLETEIRQEKEIDTGEGLYYAYADTLGYYETEYELMEGYHNTEYYSGMDGNANPAALSQEEFIKLFSAKFMKDAENIFSDSFEKIGKVFEYYIVDEQGNGISNSAVNFQETQNFRYLLQISYDESGSAQVMEVIGENEALHWKNAAAVGRNNGGFRYFDFGNLEEKTGIGFRFLAPKNCTVYFGLTEEGYAEIEESGIFEINSRFWDKADAYHIVGVEKWLCLLAILLALAVFFMPMSPKIRENKIFGLPFEGVCLILLLLLNSMNGYSEISIQTMRFCEGITTGQLQLLLGDGEISEVLAYLWNLLIVFLFYVIIAYLFLCVREIREKGIKEYLKKRSYTYRFFPYLKKKVKQGYKYLTGFDISADSKKVILRLVIVNGILVSLFTLFWFGGTFAAVIYSLILYWLMRKYLSDMKKKYEVLLQAVNQIAEGNLNVTITEDLGMFEPFKPQIEKIQEGFKNAVEEEVKSQRMKTELITNVSHDLKTPLTAIITYINLLKEDEVTQEQQKEYLDTLERKSLRLKVLIEDLFEVSKATSRNLSLNPMDVDIVDLLKQVNFELEEKLKAANLDIRFQSSEERIVLKLDSQKTYRIYENLVGNAAKYALPGTRVYMSVEKQDGKVKVEIKNISAEEIGVASEELVERFVRGDASRNTEGSGLGLAIAKSFTELQGGKMEICLDGDLFKVITEWPM